MYELFYFICYIIGLTIIIEGIILFACAYAVAKLEKQTKKVL